MYKKIELDIKKNLNNNSNLQLPIYLCRFFNKQNMRWKFIKLKDYHIESKKTKII